MICDLLNVLSGQVMSQDLECSDWGCWGVGERQLIYCHPACKCTCSVKIMSGVKREGYRTQGHTQYMSIYIIIVGY